MTHATIQSLRSEGFFVVVRRRSPFRANVTDKRSRTPSSSGGWLFLLENPISVSEEEGKFFVSWYANNRPHLRTFPNIDSALDAVQKECRRRRRRLRAQASRGRRGEE